MLRNLARRLLPPELLRALRHWLQGTPGVASLYTWLNPRLRAQRVTRRTALVVDGFPRSANGFASYALANLLSEEDRMSSLTHAPDTIRRAARLGVPCVLLVRDPDAVVSSLLTYDPQHSPASAFMSYARYYERVRDVAPDVVVADFDTVTQNLAEVVGRLNTRYGMDLSQDAAEAMRPEDVFAQIDARAEEKIAAGDLDPTVLASRISRPVSGRQHPDVSDGEGDWTSKRKRAWRIYEEISRRA